MPLLSTLKYSTSKSSAGAGGKVILSAYSNSIDEGDQITFLISSAAPGIDIPYTITGITQDDLVAPSSLTGVFPIDADGNGQLTVVLSQIDQDYVDETLTLTLDGRGIYIDVAIINTSVYGEAVYDIPGTYSWTCPDGVTSVCAVAIGGGGGSDGGPTTYTGGGGGGLGYRNNISVTPGQNYHVAVGAGGRGAQADLAGNGGNSSFHDLARGLGGKRGRSVSTSSSQSGGAGGSYFGDGGGVGGTSGTISSIYGSSASSLGRTSGGGSGAGGYGASGGNGGGRPSAGNPTAGTSSSNGGGGGGGASFQNDIPGDGGGASLYGTSSTGTNASLGGAAGGNGGYSGWDTRYSKLSEWPLDAGVYKDTQGNVVYRYSKYGGGAGAFYSTVVGEQRRAGHGAVRIMWGGGRSFPSNADYVDPSDISNATLIQTLDNPNTYNTSNYDYFGDSIAISGNYAIVGVLNEDDAGGLDSGKAYIFNVTTGNLIFTIDNPNDFGTSVDDYFGNSVAISGNYAIVGAYLEDEGADNNSLASGKAYIFKTTTGDWTDTTKLHTLDNPNTYEYPQSATFVGSDLFGAAVAIDGNYAIVGAPGEDIYNPSYTYTQSGQAYVFDVTTGNYIRTIYNPNGYSTGTNDSFGAVITISGNYVFFGVPGEDSPQGNSSGRVYVYHIASGGLVGQILNPTPVQAEYFGSSVAASGNYCIVGAYGESTTALNSGKAYIFKTNNGSWGDATLPLYTLDNPNDYNGPYQDWFGRSVAMSGNYAIVSAPYEGDGGGTISGKAYIFDVTTGLRVHTLDNPNAYGISGSDQFGNAVAMDGNYVFVAAPFEDDAGGLSSGKAYIFKTTTGDWTDTTALHTLDNPNDYGGNANDLFGYSIGISGNYAIVGAYTEDDAGGTDSGKAYIFNVTTGALVHTLDNPNAYGTSVTDVFGIAVAIDGNYAIVSAISEDDAGGTDSGKAYIFNVTTGLRVHTLDNPNPYGTSVSDQFGNSVGISGNYAIVGASNEDYAGGTSSGKAYIFDVTTGLRVHTLDNPNPYGTSDVDLFGYSVAISGDRAIVGARYEDDASGTESGKAYIFDVTTGLRVHTLDNPNPYGTSLNDWFGSSVAISGDRAIVGAYYENDAGGSGSGKAYIFDVTTGTLLHTLDNPNPYGTSSYDYFGWAVGISTNYAIVGARYEDDASGTESGKAYIYNVHTGAFLRTLDNQNDFGTSTNDSFGGAVAISGNYVFVGAPNEDDASGLNSGKAYIYRLAK
jgi:hypothetical protein